MIRIGIVGSDNSHAIAFSRLCNVAEKDGRRGVRGARVTHLFGLDGKRNAEVAGAGKIPHVVDDPQEMLGEVDAVLVVFRHGDLHLPYALPFIRAGVPTFVDKPLAVKPADARRLVREALRNKTPLTSFSTVRFAPGVIKATRAVKKGTSGGVVFGPADPKSRYGGLIFYGIHTVETMLEVFGCDVARVRAVRTKVGVSAECIYRDGSLVNLQFISRGARGFGLLAHTSQGHLYHELDLGTCYRDGFKVFHRMFRTGDWPLTPGQLVRPVEVTAAVVEACESGREVRLGRMMREAAPAAGR